MRLFYALKPSEELLYSIQSWRAPLMRKHPKLKWVKASNIHITLLFLGERLTDEVIPAFPSAEAVKSLPIKYTIHSAGTFGWPPSVLWLSGSFSRGIYRIARLLEGVYGEDESCLKARFRPHLTVARARRGDTVPEVAFEVAAEGVSGEILLVGSTLSPQGPEYRVIRSYG